MMSRITSTVLTQGRHHPSPLSGIDGRAVPSPEKTRGSGGNP
jgi:hypothetical protein